MFAVIKNNNDIIAFHKKKSIIMNFYNNYKNTNKNETDIYPIKMSDKKAKEHPNYENLYLFRYGDTYIQAEYLCIHQLDNDQYLYDLKYARDIIIRVIEFTNDKKELKHLSKTLSIFEREIDNTKKYTPSVNQLQTRLNQYEEYRNFSSSYY